MPPEPLPRLSPPSFAAFHVNAGAGLEWLFYIVFGIWAIYTLVAAYHWLRYSHAPVTALAAIAAHIVVSLALLGYALSGTPLL